MEYNFKQLANLEDMKLMASGNPMKLAEVAVKNHELKSLIEEHFGEQFPFLRSFKPEYLKSLKAYAEENPDDESAQVRYMLQKERDAVREVEKTAHIDRRVLKSDLFLKLSEGSLSKSDLISAEKLARQNGSPENMVLYSTIKRHIETGGNVE
ncbi:hypothetical protein [Bacillus massiliglaciei]|uniref:hypothetical protein n=1 Tax=Bacillus massiliglaciei TaxID=1816693 RepID=UPI000DA626EE|nr:hypothetical protein [Bacillus massiliglaciei]